MPVSSAVPASSLRRRDDDRSGDNGWRTGSGRVDPDGSIAALAESALNTGDLAVRSTDAAVGALIAQAARESRTFERMVETIRASNGIVYVQPR